MKSAFHTHPLLLFLLATCFAAQAHNGTVRGTVYDAATRLPLRGAYVTVAGKLTSTDFLGTFRVENLAPGRYPLGISFVGYQTHRDTVTVRENETTFASVYLGAGAVDLSEVKIVSPTLERLGTLSAVDIQLRPVRTAQDILRMVPGLFIAQHAGGGKAEQIFLRGFDADHGTDVNISVDGMAVNMVSHAHGQGYADLHFLIPETVEAVQFEKGPYFAQKGNQATAGFVEFRTKDALAHNLLRFEQGQFNTSRALAMLNLFGKKTPDQTTGAYLAAEYATTRGYFDAPQHFNRLNLFLKYHASFSDNTQLSVSASTFSSQWDASGQVPDRAVASGLIGRWGAIDATEGGKTGRQNLNFQLTRALGDGAVLRNQVYLSRYDFDLYSNFTFFLNDSLNGDQIRQRETRTLVGYNGSYVRENYLGKRRLTTELGAGLRSDFVPDVVLSRTVQRRPLSPIRQGAVRETNASVYLSETLDLTDRLALNAALRYDRFRFEYVNALDSAYRRLTRSRGVFSPKLNLYFTASDRLRLFANAGIGFHSNDARVVLQNEADRVLPRAFGLEAGASAKLLPNVFVKASIWQLDLEQEFVYVGDEGVVEPGGRTRRQGVDVSLRYQPLPWLYADLDLNAANPRLRDAERAEANIPLAPRLTSIGGLTVKTRRGWSGSLRYRYLGSRPANEAATLTAEGYFLADALLSYSHPKFNVTLSAENLLNSAWKEAQFDTESRLRGEASPVSEIHFTPGTPFFAKVGVSYLF